MDSTGRHTCLLAGAIVLLGAPLFAVRHVPLTDLPQHTAIVSILLHHDDPAWGLRELFSVDYGRTLYLTPYALALALCRAFSLETAMRIVVAAALLAIPLGTLAVLRASGRPPALVLLAMPLAYNRTFFWGFLNFNLGLGLALVAFALAVAPDRRGRTPLLVAAALVLIPTHPFGLAVLVSLGLAWRLVGGPTTRRWPPAMAIGIGGLGAWWWSTADMARFSLPSAGLAARVVTLPLEVLGGYDDTSETWLLAAVIALFLWGTWPRMPISRARWVNLSRLEQVGWIGLAGCLALYFTMPYAARGSTVLYPRFAVCAAVMLPLAGSLDGFSRPKVGTGLLAVAAVAGILNASRHLVDFDRESRTFDVILAAMPPHPRVLSAVTSRNGTLMRTTPYLHFASYIQASRGGITSPGFPEWSPAVPVRLRPEAGLPETPSDLRSELGTERSVLARHYDYLVVKRKRDAPLANPSWGLILAAGEWELYVSKERREER